MRSLIVTISFLAISGCAPNMIAFGKFFNTVSLIDSEGNIAEGRVITNSETKDGEIEISNTKYGNLTGKFSTQTSRITSIDSGIGAVISSDQTILVPSMGTQTIASGNSIGQAYLASGGKVVLRCSISVDFVVDKLMGGVYTIGGGVCADKDRTQVNLQFTK